MIFTIGIAPPKTKLDECISWISNLGYNYKILDPLNSHLTDIDALLLTGGADIGKNETRDNIEEHWIREAFDKNIPIIGICRGLQMVNLFLGGTLIEDINESSTKHTTQKDLIKNDLIKHDIDSSWHFIEYENDFYKVNSRHHQAIDILGDCLTPTAKSLDGIIEIVESSNCFLVQFHPEREEMKNLPIQEIIKEKIKILIQC